MTSSEAGAELPADGAEQLVRLLVGAGRTVAVAESLTGGAVTEAIVAVPGASACLRGGVVAYATDLKAELLGVDPRLLARLGPVHAEVAMAMAAGVRARLGADYGLATTGVAGPEPQGGHQPGTVHVAVLGPDDGEVESFTFAGTQRGDVPGPSAALGRQAVRVAARDACLALALRLVRNVGSRHSSDDREHGPTAVR